MDVWCFVFYFLPLRRNENVKEERRKDIGAIFTFFSAAIDGDTVDTATMTYDVMVQKLNALFSRQEVRDMLAQQVQSGFDSKSNGNCASPVDSGAAHSQGYTTDTNGAIKINGGVGMHTRKRWYPYKNMSAK